MQLDQNTLQDYCEVTAGALIDLCPHCENENQLMQLKLAVVAIGQLAPKPVSLWYVLDKLDMDELRPTGRI